MDDEEGELKQSSSSSSSTFTSTSDLSSAPSFEAMGLKEELLRGIYHYGFERPSSIQQRAILPILKGRDVIAQSQSGTGQQRPLPPSFSAAPPLQPLLTPLPPLLWSVQARRRSSAWVCCR